MERFNKQFQMFMAKIPQGEYGNCRERLCLHMNWSYWQYNRRLNGETMICRAEREKIESFF